MKPDSKALPGDNSSSDEVSSAEVEISPDEKVDVVFVTEADRDEYFRILYEELGVLQESKSNIPLVFIPVFHSAPDLVVICSEEGIRNLKDLKLAAETGYPNLDDIFSTNEDRELLEFVLSLSSIDAADTFRVKH